MKTKEEILKLEKETATLFYKSGLETPKRILPNIIFDWMTAEYCFKVRVRTLISKIRISSNFNITDEGDVIIETRNDKPIIVHNEKGYDKAKLLIDQIKKRTGIDVTII